MSDKKSDPKSSPNGFSYGHSGSTKSSAEPKPKVSSPADKKAEPKR